MISKERLRQVNEVLFHGHCPDGTWAAVNCSAAFKYLEKEVKLTPIVYGTDVHKNLEPAPGQLFVDITPPIGSFQKWKNTDVIILDHHATAKHVTEELGGIYGGPEHCGASLAYEYILKQFAYDDFDRNWVKCANLSRIRDTWQKTDPEWTIACGFAEAVRLYGHEYLTSKFAPNLSDSDTAELLKVGKILHDSHLRKLDSALEKACKRETEKGIKVAFINVIGGASDVCNHLIDNGFPIAIGYSFLSEDNALKCIISLRSDGSILVNKMAEKFGGGGHPRAAGCNMISNDLDMIFSRLLTAIDECVTSNIG